MVHTTQSIVVSQGATGVLVACLTEGRDELLNRVIVKGWHFLSRLSECLCWVLEKDFRILLQ